MKYNIRKNWVESFGLMLKKPIVILPFFIVAFLEALALELIYFSSRKPLSYIFGPIIRKFFNEVFMHYPGHLIILSRLLYAAQVVIYVFIGALLTGICVNIVKNLRMGLPLKTDSLIKNAFKRYLSFFIFAVLVIVLIFLLKRLDVFVFSKVMVLIGKRLPQILLKLSPFILTLFIFITNVALQAFLVLTIPAIVIQKKSLLKALWTSVTLGFRNFLSLFTLLFLPFLIYLPITFLKTGTPKLMDMTFPEMNLYITAFGIILALFAECFITVCAAQFLLDKE